MTLKIEPLPIDEERARLEAAVEDAPDDPSRYAVLGDWLAQRGDPRGELIALQLLETPDRRQRERVKALLTERGIRCMRGPLAQWRWGYVHTATLMRPLGPGDEARPELGRLLAHPSLRFLRALTLGQEPMERALEELGRAAPRVLDTLGLYSPRRLSLERVPTLGALTHLHLSVAEVEGTLPRLPALRALTLSFLHWAPDTADALFGANRGALRRVTLGVAGAVEPSMLAPILALPVLEHLTIEASELGLDAIELLASSPGAEGLTTLDLSRSGLTERAARRALQLTRHLPRLSTLVLGEAVDG